MNHEAPLNYFLHAGGPASQPTLLLDWVFTTIAVAVCVTVTGLLLFALVRQRDQGAGLVVGPHNGLKWVAIGTGISTAILLAMTVYALIVLNQVGNRPDGPGIDITVTAYDWWWRVDYPGATGFTTANEMHIPVGVPVRMHLESADVIHGFWVPQLAGKTQAIPGLHNTQWLQADTPGTYIGQCTQYCGVQHAHMGFQVVAESPARYAAWLTVQYASAHGAQAVAVTAGRDLFMARCAGCHTIRGTVAGGDHGPDLTHLQSRQRIAAGVLRNTPENLMQWITHAQTFKPGSRMPDMALDAHDAATLSAFLATLQ